jgi:hypothetical protein
MYVKVVDGNVNKYPYEISDLHKDNPKISFPKNMTDEALAAYGVYPVVEVDQPDYNPSTHNLVLNTQPTLIDGTWTIGFSSVAKTDEQVVAYNEDIVHGHRLRRGSALIMSDWTQMPDSPLSDEAKASWVTYRQALRDISKHSNWPNLSDDDWPTEP